MAAPPSDTSRSESLQVDTPQAYVPRTVLLTRSAAQGAAFARALAEESAQNGLGSPGYSSPRYSRHAPSSRTQTTPPRWRRSLPVTMRG